MRGSEASQGLRNWGRSGAPWIWLNAAAMGAGILAVAGLFVLLAVRGLGHFWPGEVLAFDHETPAGTEHIVGELAARESTSRDQYLEAAPNEPGTVPDPVERWLIKTGNRREAAPGFRWVFAHRVTDLEGAARRHRIRAYRVGQCLRVPDRNRRGGNTRCRRADLDRPDGAHRARRAPARGNRRAAGLGDQRHRPPARGPAPRAPPPGPRRYRQA